MKGIVIAGVQSGTGKTTVSMAVMRCLRNKGRSVAPFKVGPDYIDPKFHRFITGNHSYNLDSWMLGENTLRHLFLKNNKIPLLFFELVNSITVLVMTFERCSASGNSSGNQFYGWLCRRSQLSYYDLEVIGRGITVTDKNHVHTFLTGI